MNNNTVAVAKNGVLIRVPFGDLTKLSMANIESVKDLLSINYEIDNLVFVSNFHEGVESRARQFKYRQEVSRTEHNGVTVISPTRLFPRDWGEKYQRVEWFSEVVDIGYGCWVDEDHDIDVKSAGAVGDGVIDDSESFKAAFDIIVGGAVMPRMGSNALLGKKIYIPDTDEYYRIAQPQMVMSNLGSARSYGLTFEGESVGIEVFFDYDGDDYLLYNNNQFLFVRFKNLYFSCESNLAKFLYSTGNGGAQDYYYDDVTWNGRWEKLFVLRGQNNNCEWGLLKCSVTASVRDVMMDVAESDQFLNYWFVMSKIWLYDGQCVRASAGGHFKFDNCDWSGLSPNMELNKSVNGGHLFELLGSTHARGVCDFHIKGGRFEHKNLHSKLIYCEWNQGHVKIEADTLSTYYSSMKGYDTLNPVETVVFNRGNTQGPIVEISGSHQGVHKYISDNYAFNYPAVANYSNVQTPWQSINDFIKSEVVNGNNAGAKWVIECDGVQSKAVEANNGQRVLNCSLGAKHSKSGRIKKHSFTFSRPDGHGTPLNTSEMLASFPSGAVITGVTWVNAGGLTSSVVPNFQLLDGGGNVISEQSQRISDGWHEEDSMYYPLDRSRSELKLIDSTGTANQSSSNMRVMVEYIGG